MRHIVRNSCLVLALLVLVAAYVWPPTETIRRGKDLAGGFSLTYQLQIPPGQNADEVMDTTITVLKDRIDPNGLMEISIVPQGRDRLEITMPLPSDRVKELRAEYLGLLEEIRQAELSPREFDRVMSLPTDEREAQLVELASGNEERLAQLREASSIVDQERDAGIRLQAALDAGAPEDEIEIIIAEQAAASIGIDTSREQILGSILRADDLRQALELSSESRFVLDDTADEPFEIPSPRAQAITNIRESHPGDSARIDAVIAKHTEFEQNRKTLADPSDLIRLLKGAGVLEFRIAPGVGEHPEEQRLRQDIREQGPRLATATDARWFRLADPVSWVERIQQAEAMLANPSAYFSSRDFVVEEYDGSYYMLLWDTRGAALTQTADVGSWRVASAFTTTDPDSGRPAIGFRMDARGAGLLGRLTENNIGEPMAVLLDNRVITAPTLNAKITTNGIITGIDSADERENIIRTLNAGTLTATLSPEPISQSILGPELGQDNLDAGMVAGLTALVAVSVFMVFYYFLAGGVAVFALACNAILIVGMLALGNAALTLPGIAGIILTFGMAVDANVLIFERIREERRHGLDLKPAVRLGYQKALSSIVDGNVTNLIVCLVLANIGTQEIKGFAITLGIGVVGTMFSALVISRLIFALFTEKMNLRKLPMLPTEVPAIEKLLEPKIDWLRLRKIFVVISLAYVGLGLFMVFSQRGELLDTEFRGGTAVTMRLGQDDAGQRLTMARPDVQKRVAALGEAAEPGTQLRELATAEVLPVNPAADGVTSDTFRVKTLATDAALVAETIQTEFNDVLPTKPPLTFGGDTIDDSRIAPVFAISDDRLGEVIGQPNITADVSAYDGGVAVVLANILPVSTEEDLHERLDFMRRDREFSDQLSRQWELIILKGSPEAVESAAMVVVDEGLLYTDSQERWEAEVAAIEWELARRALSRTESLAGVDSFDPAIARSFRGKAVAAVVLSFLLITIYIWVRFGSVRYSLAALVALLHDVLTALGLIALAGYLYQNNSTTSVAQSVLILPFKIDLSLIAALLTIIGYSLNDSIIIMDRIRENRGKLDYASRRVVNLSINQTISRTVITSGTTLMAVLILYIAGGEGVRAFSFTLLIGVLVGTYSSIAVAAPLVWSGKSDPGESHAPKSEPAPGQLPKPA